MTHTYSISGMTCGSCVTKVRSELLKLGDVTEADVQLSPPQARISMLRHISAASLQTALSRAGNYTITETGQEPDQTGDEAPASGLVTYKPILLIGAFLTGITLLVQWAGGAFHFEDWMRQFMAAFFLSFSFFKFLDLKGFAENYAGYDLVARRWFGWGYVYPFVELLLGLLFLTDTAPLLTNGVTFVVLGISLVGVVQSVLQKKSIRCACLGAVFQLPMSTVTIVEDALMVGMSAWMLITMN